MKTLFLCVMLCMTAAGQTTSITKGGSYNLAIYNSNPNAACVAIETTEAVIISGWFWSAGDGIDIMWHGANVTVKNARFFAVNAGRNETAAAINADGVQFLGVENCYISGFNEGILAIGDGVTNPVVWIAENQIEHPTGQACGTIQLIDYAGVAGTVWANDMHHDESPEASDCINLYNVQGQQYNHFSVQGNLVCGVLDNNYGQPMPNAGITTDGYAYHTCKYIDVDNNTVVHCSNGITLAYGGHQEASGNVVVSDGILANGEMYPWGVGGMKVYKGRKGDRIENNQIAVQNKYGRTDVEFGDGTLVNNVSLWPGQVVTKAMEEEAIRQWHQGNRQNGITIGPQ